METSQNPAKLFEQIFSKRLESTKELSNNFNKLIEHINPLIEGTEIQELIKKIEHHIKIDLNIDDLVLFTSVHGIILAREITIPKIPLKVECPKCKTLIYDFSGLEGIYNKK